MSTKTSRFRWAGFGMLGLLAALTVGTAASAATTSNHSGTICRAADQKDASALRLLPEGLLNDSSSTRVAVCPLVRSTLNTGGAEVYVDVRHTPAWQRTYCIFFSHAAGGRFLNSYGGDFGGSNSGYIHINLARSGNSDFTSDYSVMCWLPAKAVITGVHLLER